MKTLCTLIATALLSTSLLAQTWQADATNTQLGFEATHLMISQIEGSFNDFNIDVTGNSKSFKDLNFTVQIDVQSIDTDNRQRDKHLRSKDFFHTDRYPYITFESTFIKALAGENKYRITGYLTLNGVKKLIQLNAEKTGTIYDPINNQTKMGIKIKGEINRHDFDLAWNVSESADRFAVGDIITLDCNLRLNSSGNIASK